jgi:hypothetical protein
MFKTRQFPTHAPREIGIFKCLPCYIPSKSHFTNEITADDDSLSSLLGTLKRREKASREGFNFPALTPRVLDLNQLLALKNTSSHPM